MMKAPKVVSADRRPLRRREQRVLRRLMPRRLLVLTVKGREPQPTYGIVNDISDCGAGIVADRLLSSGRDVRLRICFYPQVCFDTEARVVWGRDGLGPREGGHGLALNGVLFAAPLDLETLGSHEALGGNGRSYKDSAMAASLEYLKYQIPNYPFDRRLDNIFVAELLADFPDLDVLEEIKTFRWYHDSDPVARVANPRAALRRWMSGSSPNGRPAKWETNGRKNGGNGRNGTGTLSGETFRSWVSLLRV